MFDNRGTVILCAYHELIVTLHEPANICIQYGKNKYDIRFTFLLFALTESKFYHHFNLPDDLNYLNTMYSIFNCFPPLPFT
jgi:hypothetical protein